MQIFRIYISYAVYCKSRHYPSLVPRPFSQLTFVKFCHFSVTKVIFTWYEKLVELILIARFTFSFTRWTSSSDSKGTFTGHAGGSLEVAQQRHVELRWQIRKPHPQDYMNLGKRLINMTHQMLLTGTNRKLRTARPVSQR